MTQRLCIVDRQRLDLFQELSREFRESSGIDVIFDRRIGERRRTAPARIENRRRGERRQYRTDLRLLGWMVAREERAAGIPLTDAQPA
jgi:hypothetical protein